MAVVTAAPVLEAAAIVVKVTSFRSDWMIPLLPIDCTFRKNRSLERCRTQSSCMKIVRRSLRCSSE